MKLDEGSRDDAEVKKKKQRRKHVVFACTLQVNKIAYKDRRDSVV